MVALIAEGVHRDGGSRKLTGERAPGAHTLVGLVGIAGGGMRPGFVCMLLALVACEPDSAGPLVPDQGIRVGTDIGPPPERDQGPDMAVRRDDLGDPCTSNDECQSGFCVLVRAMERVCTRKCGNDDDCPEDWICRQVTNAGADVTFICVPEDAPCAGADLQTDPEHCGACDQPCAYDGAEGLCVEGSCQLGPCAEGFHDLDGDDENGCE